MSNTSMHDYARMGAPARLTEIAAEIAAIRGAFPELGGQPQKRRGRRPKARSAASVQLEAPKPAAPRKRRKLSAAARRRISESTEKALGGAAGHGFVAALPDLDRFLMPDPQVPLNCPLCGVPLVYLRSEGETHFYRCPHHGSVILPPDGRVRAEHGEPVN